MSANLSELPEQQGTVGYKRPPKHTRFKKGQSGNPGGTRHGFVYPVEAYKRLGSISLEKLRGYKPKGAIEAGIKQALLRAAEADDWQAAHAALKEITDRLEGKAEQKKSVNEAKTITVRFERPQFTNYGNLSADAASGSGEDTQRSETLQRTGVRAALREIAIGEIPVDRDES